MDVFEAGNRTTTVGGFFSLSKIPYVARAIARVATLEGSRIDAFRIGSNGPHATEYATAVELTQQGFVLVRIRNGGHIVVHPDNLRPA